LPYIIIPGVVDPQKRDNYRYPITRAKIRQDELLGQDNHLARFLRITGAGLRGASSHSVSESCYKASCGLRKRVARLGVLVGIVFFRIVVHPPDPMRLPLPV
jgi:hypothetical protein